VSDISRAFDAFTSHMASIGWVALALAVLCHLAKGAVRARAWRNVLAAAYPDVPIRWRSAFGAYAAGVGLNSVLPARIGDLVRLYLMRRRIPGASYPTLASSLLVEAIFDTLVSVLLVAWAIHEGLFPGLDVLPRLPSIDWLWAFHHPRAATTIVAVALAAGIALFAWAARHIEAFGRRLAQGVTILRTPREYARRVLAWQLVEWPLRLATLGLFLHAFDMPATVRNTLLTQATQSVATALPLTPAGIGTEQALLVYIFLGSAPSSVVLSFSVGMKVVLIVVNLVVGLAALALMTRTLRLRGALRTAAGDRHPAEVPPASVPPGSTPPHVP
jgi:uncharacterized membrane protein YbhN (UPF0104 family)